MNINGKVLLFFLWALGSSFAQDPDTAPSLSPTTRDQWGASVDENLVQITYYVNGSTGSDANSGTNPSSALQSIGVAWGKADSDGKHSKIIIANGNYTIGHHEFGEKDKLFVLEGAEKGKVIIKVVTGSFQGIYAVGKWYFVMRNLSFQGSDKLPIQSADWNPLGNNRHWLIEDCDFSNNKSGLGLHSMANLTIRRTTITNNTHEGIAATLVDSEIIDSDVSNNQAENAYSGNVWYANFNVAADGLLLKNTKFNGSKIGNGLQSDLEFENVIIEGCDFSGNKFVGFKTEIARGPITIRNSTIKNNGTGIALETTFDFTCEGCEIKNNADQAMYITWKYRDKLYGHEWVWSVGGDGNLRVAPGSNWTYLQKMNGTRRTAFKNSVVQGNVLFMKRAIDTDPQHYKIWVESEYTGSGNCFYSTQPTPFQNANMIWGDLAGWKSSSGTDTDAKWDASCTVEAIPVDSIKPSIPASVSIENASGVYRLKWNSSTDNDAVSQYRVYRNDTLISSPTINSYIITGLAAGITAQFTVVAVDRSGNESAKSAMVAFVQPMPQANDIIWSVNAGGSNYIATNSVGYDADRDFTSGTAYSNAGIRTGTENSIIYETERYGSFQYAVPVPMSGNYSVLLQLSEGYHQEAGARVFSVQVEGSTLIDNMDIYRQVGYKTALDTLIQVDVQDGTLNLEWIAHVENPLVNAIVVRYLGSSGPVGLRQNPKPSMRTENMMRNRDLLGRISSSNRNVFEAQRFPAKAP
jgi:hypothetical protein